MSQVRASATVAIVVVVCSSLWACSQQEAPAAAADGGATAVTAAAATPGALLPLMGGVVRQVGAYVVELVTGPEGRIEAHVRDAEGQPVPPESVTVTAEVAGAEEPVQVPLVREETRYVGTVIAPAAGPREVSVVVEPEAGEEVEIAFPAVEITPPAVVVEPIHNGQVTVVGDNRVEVATAADGQVYVSVTDMRGVPLPPDVVTLQHVTVVTPTGPRLVALQPQGAIFVGTLGVPPPPTFSVRFDLGVRGRWYRRVRMRRYHPLPPTAVVVVPPRFHHPRGWAKGWGPHRVKGPRHHGKGWGPYRVKGGRHHPGRGWAKGHRPGHRSGPPGHYGKRGGRRHGPPGHVKRGGGGGGRGHVKRGGGGGGRGHGKRGGRGGRGRGKRR